MGVFTALLIGGQLVFSFISGVEIVTVLLLTYAFACGVRKSLLVATAFSLLRCLVFGFMPNVVILYLVYYNAFCALVGGLGNGAKHKLTKKNYALLIGVAVVSTLGFTLLDNLITPLLFRYTREAWLAYAYASIATCIPHVSCVAVTVAVLFPVLYRVTAPFALRGNT